MKKYIKQRNKWDCGPIALVNAEIWAGGNSANYKGYKKILKYRRKRGVNPTRFDEMMLYSAIDKNFFPFRVVNSIEMPSIAEVRKYVNSKGCVILGIDFKDWAHVGLVVKITRCYVTLVNWCGQAVKKIHVNTFKKWIENWSIIYAVEKS